MFCYLRHYRHEDDSGGSGEGNQSASSIKKYNRLIAEWIQSGRQSCDAQQEVTVGEFMLAYVAFAKRYYRKAGKVTREYGHIVEVCRAIRPLYGNSRAVKFGPLALKTIRQSLIDSDISRKHINKQVDRVKRMFRWAAAEELIPAGIPQALNMVTGLRKGRTEEGLRVVADQANFWKWLHRLDDLRHMARRRCVLFLARHGSWLRSSGFDLGVLRHPT